jgi:hypothetical protein
MVLMIAREGISAGLIRPYKMSEKVHVVPVGAAKPTAGTGN